MYRFHWIVGKSVAGGKPDFKMAFEELDTLEGKYDVYVKPKYRKVEGVRASCNLQLYFRCDHYNDDPVCG